MRFQTVLLFVAFVSAVPLQLHPASSESTQIKARQDPSGALPAPSKATTNMDVNNAIEQIAAKALANKREAVRVNVKADGKNFVKAMLIYFADGSKVDRSA
ncbi:hypothetical protein TWF694_000370 [Orbilia ellipsospora]|uniref:Uncharacterized protein n=1 Tax=Orbilia ellipsospora TaxID=2528407 RepID=A0AAV9XPY4_9PEZI